MWPVGLGLHKDASDSSVKQPVGYLRGDQVRGRADPWQWGWVGTPWKDTLGRKECTSYQKGLNAEQEEKSIRL